MCRMCLIPFMAVKGILKGQDRALNPLAFNDDRSSGTIEEALAYAPDFNISFTVPMAFMSNICENHACSASIMSSFADVAMNW